MTTKNTEWKRVSLSKDNLDFTGALHSSLENDGDSFISLSFTLKSGRKLRIRKNDYSVCIEEPVVPMMTKYLFKTDVGIKTLFDSREEANAAMRAVNCDSEVEEIKVPFEVKQIEGDYIEC